MTNEKINIEFALLSWIRLHESIEKDGKNKKEVQAKIEKFIDYLSSKHIKDLEIIYKSKDYYTIRYLREGQSCLKRFTSLEVDHHVLTILKIFKGLIKLS